MQKGDANVLDKWLIDMFKRHYIAIYGKAQFIKLFGGDGE